MVVGFEGEEASIAATRAGALAILKRFGGFSLGASVGKTWSKDKFNIPYLRDYVMDYSVMCDVAETSTTWSNVVPLYHATVAPLKSGTTASGAPATSAVTCRTPTRPARACTSPTRRSRSPGVELEQYYAYKQDGHRRLHGRRRDAQSPPCTFLLVHTFKLSVDGALILPLLIMFICKGVSCMPDILATAEISGVDIEGTQFNSRIQGGILCDGIGSFISALGTGLPIVSRAVNNGVIVLTSCAVSTPV